MPGATRSMSLTSMSSDSRTASGDMYSAVKLRTAIGPSTASASSGIGRSRSASDHACGAGDDASDARGPEDAGAGEWP